MKFSCITPAIFAGAVFALSSASHAIVWNGASPANDYFGTGANWVGGTAPNFNGLAEFAGAPTARQPDLNGSVRTAITVDFQSAGWTIRDDAGGGALRVDAGKSISSAGAGVNQITAQITSSGSGNVTFNVGADNVLRLSGGTNFLQNRVLSGAGKLVIDTTPMTTFSGNPWTLDATSTLLFNTTTSAGATTWTQGRVGGTGTAIGYQYGTTTYDGATLAPGGDGTFGAEIGTLTYASNSATIRHELVFADQGILEIQLGTTLGVNDKLELILSDAGSGNLAIQAGATLNLLGTTIQDGSYTIIENIDSDPIVGTFTNVNFNGSPIDPENFTLSYSTNTVVLNVVGMDIPEPTSLGLIGLGGALFLRRRRMCV